MWMIQAEMKRLTIHHAAEMREVTLTSVREDHQVAELQLEASILSLQFPAVLSLAMYYLDIVCVVSRGVLNLDVVGDLCYFGVILQVLDLQRQLEESSHEALYPPHSLGQQHSSQLVLIPRPL